MILQKYIIAKCTLQFRFISDKSKTEEYFLDICDTKGKSWKQIAVIDIESIEPVQGKEFSLQYYTTSMFFSTSQSLKEERFLSKHIAELKDAYEQILSIIERKEHELDELAKRAKASHGTDSEDSADNYNNNDSDS